MPVSFDQIVAAFPIMWCMTLKMPHSRTRCQFVNCHQVFVPGSHRHSIDLANEQATKLRPNAFQNALLPALGTFLFSAMPCPAVSQVEWRGTVKRATGKSPRNRNDA
jgi:hypothetical protein